MRRVHAALRAFASDIVSVCKAAKRALCGVALKTFAAAMKKLGYVKSNADETEIS